MIPFIGFIFSFFPIIVVAVLYRIITRQLAGQSRKTEAPRGKRAYRNDEEQMILEQKQKRERMRRETVAKTTHGKDALPPRSLSSALGEWAKRLEEAGEEMNRSLLGDKRQRAQAGDRFASEADRMTPRRLDAQVLDAQVLQAEESLAGEPMTDPTILTDTVLDNNATEKKHALQQELFGGTDLAGLKRAFILKEVLDEPVSLR